MHRGVQNPVYLVPIEVWNDIFPLVCDQRGITAAAISRVSRYFYNAIMPYRLTSLVIYGESQIVAFHKAMEVMPSDVPRAKHLFISLIPDSSLEDAHKVCHSVIDRGIRPPGEAETQSQNSNLSVFGFHPQEYVTIQECFAGGIISQHKETLETLTYLTTVSYIKFEMFGCLPRLRDLTIICLRYKSTFYEVYNENPVYRKTQFPLLERLHLSYFGTEPLFCHDEFRRVAPGLTHLRISGRKCYPQYEKLPLRTKVFVQPILLSSQEQRTQLSHMRGILSVPSYQKRTVLLEPGHREDGRYGFFDALSDWVDVSIGRDTFWGRDNMVTIDNLAARSIC